MATEREAVLDLYKLAVEMADRVSARRGVANSFLLTVQSVFVAALAPAASGLTAAPRWAAVAVLVTGLILSAVWWLQLRSYHDLNRAKFTVITSLEHRLPAKVFADELAALRPRYAELGTIERLVPGAFALLHLLIFVSILWG
jgi:uncharacterized membrane protein YhdT